MYYEESYVQTYYCVFFLPTEFGKHISIQLKAPIQLLTRSLNLLSCFKKFVTQIELLFNELFDNNDYTIRRGLPTDFKAELIT